jgi:hypothetical protein
MPPARFLPFSTCSGSSTGSCLARPDLADRQEHRLPYNVATDILATIECVVTDSLRPAVASLQRSAAITDAELERDFFTQRSVRSGMLRGRGASPEQPGADRGPSGSAAEQDRPGPGSCGWSEAEAIRETALLYLDDPADRETLRRLGRLIFNLALETTRLPFEESITHAELRAAVADLRFIEGFLDAVRRSADESDLPPDEEDLTIFAGRMARQVGALVESIEVRL